jgi:hypothetical protein
MSVAPFAYSSGNPVQLRILSPLVAHLLGMDGTRYYWFPLIARAIRPYGVSVG